MAETKMTIQVQFDDEAKALMHELIDAVKKLDDKIEVDQSFGDPIKTRLVEGER